MRAARERRRLERLAADLSRPLRRAAVRETADAAIRGDVATFARVLEATALEGRVSAWAVFCSGLAGAFLLTRPQLRRRWRQ